MSVRRPFAALAALASLISAFALASPTGAAPPPAKDPVIIVAGFTTGPLIEPGYIPFEARLEAAGYSVDIFSYPDYGVGDIHVNAGRLKSFADGVRARTGAAKVDLVAHSMGGLVSRDYVKTLGGAAVVDSLIMLGTPNYGTAAASIASFFGFGNCFTIVACQQMSIGSSFLASLNAGDDTIGSVSYTSIATRSDEVVFPYTTSFLANDGNIANVTVQNQCWLRWPGHLGLIFDGAVADGVVDALRHTTVRMNCFAL